MLPDFLKKSLLFAIYIPVSSLFSYTTITDQSSLEIKTPQLLERKTLKITLKNGIEAVLISDPKVLQSAIAVSCPAGSWNDPKEYPGTAHFCEHMLFMGTKKYPGEDDFFRYVKDHGGQCNAYTAGDHTVYIASSNNDAFPGVIDRLSHFFIDPLFPKDSVERELKAVDQENDKNIQNDGWRRWMILKETGNQNHPNALFSTGNAATIGKIPVSVLKNWYETYYSPSGMRLIVISNESPEHLAASIETSFDLVPKRAPASTIPSVSLTSSEQTGHLITIEPIQDLRTLSLTWELTLSSPSDHSDQVIASMIQSRHEGSLFDLLNKEELANTLSASSDAISPNHHLFEIEISLTETGVKHVDQVVEKVFQYIQLLKQNNIPLYFYKEIKSMSVLSYEYQTQSPAYDYVSQEIEALRQQPLSVYPDYSYYVDSYQPEKFKKMVQELNPENCIFFLTAKPELTGVEFEKQEQWLGGRYSIKAIPSKQLESLHQITLNDELKIPEPNPLIPQNFELLSSPKEEKVTLLLQEPIGRLYYEPDTRFFTPQVSVKLNLRSLLSDHEPQVFAFYDFLSYSLKQKLAPIINQAAFAGLSTHIYRDGTALRIEIEGFSDKGKVLWHHLIDGLKNLSLSVEEFDRIRSYLLISYQNQTESAPFLQAFQKIRYLTRNDEPLPSQLEKGLFQLSSKDFHLMKQAIVENAYLEMFCFGNLSTQDSLDYFETTTESLQAQPIINESITYSKALQMEANQGPCRFNFTTNKMGNAALLMIQSPSSLSAKSSFLILNQAVSSAFFDTLRTKQQTGYITNARGVEQLGFLQFYFVVQSTTHEPDELIARFELFLENYLREIKTEIPKDRFELLKEEVKKELVKPQETIEAHTETRFKEAYTKSGQFDENQELARAIDQLSYEDFLDFAQAIFNRSNDKRIAILIEGENTNKKSMRYTTSSEEAFKTEQHYVNYR